jgi:hypothetical protein
MNSEDHLEALKKHFIEEIQEALYESKQDHGDTINYDLLNDKILISWKSAHLEGISFDTYVDWVSDALPHHHIHLEITKLKNVA